MNFRKVAIIALAAAAAGSFAGCSADGVNKGSDNSAANGLEATEFGGVNLALTVPVGFQVDSIHYDIVDQATGTTVKSGDADVSSAQAQAKAFVLLPPGSYVANLSSTGTQPCSGSTSVFSVVANSNQSVQAGLNCGNAQSVVNGGVFIDATFTRANTCGITKMFVGPLTQGAGEDITLSGDATANASYSWSSSVASVGTLNNATSQNASLTCGSGAGGTTTLTLTIVDTVNPTCTASQTIDVTCAASPNCGNGTIQSGETCDDGNVANNDGCSSSCLLEVCGDGIVQSSEQCEPSLSPANCTAACQLSVCGNGVIEPGEACDGGALCSATCTALTCGNGVVDAGEQCDDGDTNNANACSNACTINAVCGNGVVEPGETCDDGDTLPSGACNATCSGAGVQPLGCTSAAGQACQAANCGAEMAACQGDVLCENVHNCLYTTNCVHTVATPPLASFLDACFCGIGADINSCYISGQTATGPCVAQFQAAAAPVTGNLSIGQVFYDTAYSLGKSGLFQYCQQSLCASECGY